MADEPKIPPGAPPGTVFQVQPASSRSPNYREFYTTGFTFRGTMSDFSVVFLTLASPPGMLGMMINQEESAVTMTLPTLKVFAENLSAAVKAFEARLGPIKVDTRMRPNEERLAALVSGIDLKLIKE